MQLLKGTKNTEQQLTNVTESLRLVVAVVVLEALVLFGAIVPRQLQETLALGREAVFGNALLAGVAQKVEVEAGRLLLHLAEQRHAQRLLVELETLFCVLDADHGVVLL